MDMNAKKRKITRRPADPLNEKITSTGEKRKITGKELRTMLAASTYYRRSVPTKL